MKKALKKKKPSRNDQRLYWNADQFRALQGARPGKLYSKGPLPWRLLAYLLKLSPEVARIRSVVRKRLLSEHRIRAGEQALERMLRTLACHGYVTLEPASPIPEDPAVPAPIPSLAHATPALDRLLAFRSIK